MPKRELWQLQQMQSLPLHLKLALTKDRIRQWVNEYGEDGVYVSFSGGKDSTVLLDIVRNECGYKNIPAVFVDVPTQYPELKTFAIEFCKEQGIELEILKPKMNFFQVCEEYGFPLLSKRNAETVYRARESVKNGKYNFRVHSIGISENEAKELGLKLPSEEMLQRYEKSNGNKSKFYTPHLRYLMDAPFNISSKCCELMKKQPIHNYQKQTNRVPIIATMAYESMNRTSSWLQNGCNAFDSKDPKSQPISFWMEQDILRYIKNNNLGICSVYGEVVDDVIGTNNVNGQMTISDICGFENCTDFDAEKPMLKTTGCDRTGCVLCGFGCHLEKEGEGRFEKLKETHPKFYALLDVAKNNGVTMREAIEWVNEHGNMNIRL